MIDLNAPFAEPGDTAVQRAVCAALNEWIAQPQLAQFMCPACGVTYLSQDEVRPFLSNICRVCHGYARRAQVADHRVNNVVAAVLREWSDDKHGVTELSAQRVQALADLLERVSRTISERHPMQEYAWGWANEIRRTWRPWP